MNQVNARMLRAIDSPPILCFLNPLRPVSEGTSTILEKKYDIHGAPFDSAMERHIRLRLGTASTCANLARLGSPAAGDTAM